MSRSPLIVPTKVAAAPYMTLTNWNAHVGGNANAFIYPPSASVKMATPQGIPTDSWTSVTWQTQLWDTDDLWSATQPESLTIQTPGQYLVSAQISFSATTPGYSRIVGVRVNGEMQVAQYLRNLGVTFFGVLQTSGLITCQRGDVITIDVFHDSGEQIWVKEDGSEWPNRFTLCWCGRNEAVFTY